MTLLKRPLAIVGILGLMIGVSAWQINNPSSSSSSAGVVQNLYTEATGAGGEDTTSNTSAKNIFSTGYSLPSGTLTAGHRLHVHGCFKHSSGTTSTAYTFLFGSTSMTAIPTGNSTAAVVCMNIDIQAVDSTHQNIMQDVSNGASGAISNAQFNAGAENTSSGALAINFQEAASGTSDHYLGYLFTVDIF